MSCCSRSSPSRGCLYLITGSVPYLDDRMVQEDFEKVFSLSIWVAVDHKASKPSTSGRNGDVGVGHH